MKINVDGKEKELSFIDKNGVEDTAVFLCEYGDGVSYSEELEMYTMDQEAFNWWSNVFEIMNEVELLEKELTPELSEEYRKESFGNDLDEIASQQREWLKAHLN